MGSVHRYWSLYRSQRAIENFDVDKKVKRTRSNSKICISKSSLRARHRHTCDNIVLQASHDDFAYRRTTADQLPVLNYTICSARNMKTLHTALSEKMLWDGLKASDAEIINALLTEPVWQLAPARKDLLNESAMVNYTEDIIALGFVKQGSWHTISPLLTPHLTLNWNSVS